MNSDSSTDFTLLPERLPKHVAIIMDGNGRWAKKRLLNRIRGHEKGAETVKVVVRTCREFGIGYLTLYAFSTENWQRPKAEVYGLMELLKRFLVSERAEMMENGIRFNAIGQIERLPADVRRLLKETIDATSENRDMLLSLALSYGGRSEITRMARLIAEKAMAGDMDPGKIDEAVVKEHLYTRDMPDPDMLIRTGGDMRVSNFLLWQIAYTELFIVDTLWPDFSREELLSILDVYSKRERRFGRAPADAY